ncbi:long-chain-fatty-acid--CoA ligase 1 [Monosporozyma unispora]|nr:long-chain-fatty-acid--CoA ligase 1 [Kazachstania unispora]
MAPQQYNIIVGEAANEHETAPRRSSRAVKAALTKPRDFTCETVFEMISECCRRYKNNNSIGWRNVIDIHEEQKTVTKTINGKPQDVQKTWMYYELTPYQYITFAQMEQNMIHIGKGLVSMGLEPATEDKLHIYASTSHKWMQMYLGTQSQSIPIVTAYDTLGAKVLIHSIKQTESTAIFTDNSLLPTLLEPLKTCSNIRYVIHSEDINPEDKRQNGKIFKIANDAKEEILKARPDIKFYSFDDIMKLGIENDDKIEIHKPKAEDLSCIMYTSGSTGDPKGVVLTQANVVAGVGGADLPVGHALHPADRLICFLPLAHIFELAFEMLSFVWGSCIGYANVKTLTPASVRNCEGDLVAFKPTIMVGVAAVWETVKKGIIQQINNLPAPTRKIFWSAYYTKVGLDRWNLPGGGLIANLIFKKIKAATGGNLKFALNGGSPLSESTQRFLSNLICPMLIGYGLTETVANTTILDPSHFEFGVAGDLTGAVTVKLVDVEELGYFAKNNQGEIWIKGASVTPEYYKNPEETEKVITKDGWFQTSDIGQWEPNGHLKVIDRKKNLVKTLNGEYIALEKLESVYRSNQYVQNICVYADDTKVKPVGIIVPNHKPLITLAKKLDLITGKEDVDDEELIEHHLRDPKLQNAVLKDLLATGKDQGLVGIELLAGCVFAPEEWTPQNGYVTSAQKLKRKKILHEVKSQVDLVYSSNS